MAQRITADEVRRLLDYDPSTGTFKWRERRNGVKPDFLAPAGTVMTVAGGTYSKFDLANLHALGEWRPARGAALTQERLRAVIVYEPANGEFRWRGVYRCIPRGTRAERQIREGYLAVSLDGKPYLAHRLAWFYLHGTWPRIVDHIDSDRQNNRLENIRNVSRQENLLNQRRAKSQSHTGVLGVSPRGRRYQARIQLAGVQEELGVFDTIEQASTAYQRRKEEIHRIGGLPAVLPHAFAP